MQLDNYSKQRLIKHISYAAIVCILLLGLPLEGCFRNANLPFSKSPDVNPITVQQSHDNLQTLEEEEEQGEPDVTNHPNEGSNKQGQKENNDKKRKQITSSQDTPKKQDKNNDTP